MVAERGMCPIAGKGIITSEKTLHIRRIEYNTVNLSITIGKMAAIHAGF